MFQQETMTSCLISTVSGVKKKPKKKKEKSYSLVLLQKHTFFFFPFFSFHYCNKQMQTDTISRLQNMSSIVKTPSPLGGVQQQQKAHNSGQLDNIFNSVKRQVNIKPKKKVFFYSFSFLD